MESELEDKDVQKGTSSHKQKRLEWVKPYLAESQQT